MKDINIELICNLYLNGQSLKEISKQLEIPIRDVSHEFRVKKNEILNREKDELLKFQAQHPWNMWNFDGPIEYQAEELLKLLLKFCTQPFENVFELLVGASLGRDIYRPMFRRHNFYGFSVAPCYERSVPQWSFEKGLPKNIPVPHLVIINQMGFDMIDPRYAASSDKINALNSLLDTLPKLARQVSRQWRRRRFGYFAIILKSEFDGKVIIDYPSLATNILEEYFTKIFKIAVINKNELCVDNFEYQNANIESLLRCNFWELIIFKHIKGEKNE